MTVDGKRARKNAKAREGRANWSPEERKKDQAQKRAYYEANKEQITAQQRAHRENMTEEEREKQRKGQREGQREYQRTRRAKMTPEQREKQREGQRTRRAKTTPEQREKQRAKQRESYAVNPGRQYDANRRWRRANLRAAAALSHNRRAREVGAPGSYTVAEFAGICENQGDRCYYCGKVPEDSWDTTADHYLALARGGTNYAANIVMACRDCNTRKNTKLAEEFIAGLRVDVEDCQEPQAA